MRRGVLCVHMYTNRGGLFCISNPPLALWIRRRELQFPIRQINHAEDSIHHRLLSNAERGTAGYTYRDVPFYRAVFTRPETKEHRIITVIEVFK